MSTRIPLTRSFEHLPQIARRDERTATRSATNHRTLARRLRDRIDDRPGVDHNTSLSEFALRQHGTFPATRF